MNNSKKRLPPLNTIAAFEASARLMSFTSAASELSLSQGAVSRQIQRLEERIGTALFDRRHKKIELTEAGQVFYQAICESLVSIRRAVDNIENMNTSHVTIAASMAMSSFWVMPAALKFRDVYPEINISLRADDHIIDPTRESVDLAIHYGDGHWPHLKTYKLFNEKIFPVCTEDYAREHSIETVDDLVNCTLIDVSAETSICGTWEEWLNMAGATEKSSSIKSIQVSNFDMAYRFAEAGKGVALAWNYGPQEILRSKRLIRPIENHVETGMGEFLVTDPTSTLNPAAEKILTLFLEYAKHDGQALF